jgi:hypothetical protein
MRFAEWLLVVDLEVDKAIVYEFNAWYDDVHLPEILDCPGFMRGARYIAQVPDQCAEDKERHLTVYELESRKAAESDELKARRGMAQFADHVAVKSRVYRRHVERERGA